nr:hypothetical protein [Tanacetum cinerariifolium]
EDPEIDIEEEEPEEESVEEPKPLPGHGDQFDAHPNPQPRNMNGWVDDDDDDVEEEEDEENEDADIEEDDDAEIIFPYEMQGDKTPPPRDESSDSDYKPEAEEANDEPEAKEADDELEVKEAGFELEAEGADVELEVEELDGVPEATIGTGSQRPFAVRDFPIGFYEAGESSIARDPQFVGGLAPWALRRDLEALHRHERIREAESETSRTEVAFNRIMPPKPMSEARMREIIRDQFATSMNEFMANMNSMAGGSRGASGSGGAGGFGGVGGNADGTGVRGAGPTIPELTGCTYATFIKCDPLPFNGTEGAVAMGIEAVNNTSWSEVRKWMTREFCPWSVIQRMVQELYNLKIKGMDIDGYTNRFHELALLCSRMVEPEAVKVEQYIRGLTKSIRGDVTLSQPATINDAVRLAYQFVRELIQDKADEATEGEKRKGESNRGGRGDNRREHNHRQNQRRGNAGSMTNAAPNNKETCQKCKNKRHAGDCWKCTKCDKLGHKTERCRTSEMSCYNCNEKGHRKRDCPKLGRNGQGGNNHRGVYQLGAVNAQEDPKVVTELGSFDVIIGMDWLSKNDAAIL